MLWDDFARVGAPHPPGAAARGLSLGHAGFPDALRTAISRAGVLVEPAESLQELEYLLHSRKPDFLLCTASALAPEPEAAIARLMPAKAPPVFLVTDGRTAPPSAPRGTPFAELLGADQDALGYFLMLRATLRRRRPHVITEVLSFGKLTLNQETFTVGFEDRTAPLGMLELRVLGAMLDAPRLVWNKVFLNRVVFGPVEVKPGRQFDTHISVARRRIRERIGIDPIVAEHRLGYALSPTILGVSDILPRTPP
ncbi:MAG: hypothetical protein MUF63_18075 [Rhodobacteraceae bacterium]|jgi:hypothetical protein|nr:hypothetical protein [Paracoccaceae bacterium]